MKNKDKYYVYLHISKETGNIVYVGKGSQNGYYDRAFDMNGRAYSINDVVVKKIEFFENETDAYRAEAEWIKFLNLTDNIANKQFPTTIYCPQLNKIFYYACEAVRDCEKLGIKLDNTAISRCINGKRKTHGEFSGQKLTWTRI